MWPQQLDLNVVVTPSGALQEQVYHSRKFDTIDYLKQAIVLEWRAVPERFIDHSISEWRRRLQFAVD